MFIQRIHVAAMISLFFSKGQSNLQVPASGCVGLLALSLHASFCSSLYRTTWTRRRRQLVGRASSSPSYWSTRAAWPSQTIQSRVKPRCSRTERISSGDKSITPFLPTVREKPPEVLTVLSEHNRYEASMRALQDLASAMQAGQWEEAADLYTAAKGVWQELRKSHNLR